MAFVCLCGSVGLLILFVRPFCSLAGLLVLDCIAQALYCLKLVILCVIVIAYGVFVVRVYIIDFPRLVFSPSYSQSQSESARIRVLRVHPAAQQPFRQ